MLGSSRPSFPLIKHGTEKGAFQLMMMMMMMVMKMMICHWFCMQYNWLIVHLSATGDLYFAYAMQSDSLEGKIYKGTTYNQYLDIKAGGSYTKVNVKPGKFE